MGDSLATWISVDANAVIDYIRECALHDHDLPPTGHRADALRTHLSRARHVFVAETAYKEARYNLHKDLTHKLADPVVDMVHDYAIGLLYEYRGRTKRPDKIEYVPAAREMYAAISGDPYNQKFSKWRKKKSVFVDAPMLGSDTNDLRILSTAAYYARYHKVEFWTHDMDFTMFADEIDSKFGLKVVDSYRLGGISLQPA